jgi:hypothetical protein
LCLIPQAGWGQDIEVPPTLSAAQILPAGIVKGPHHTVDERVLNDGYMNHYTIHSRFGQFEVVSTAKLRKRVDEITALVAMEQVKGTDVFGDAIVKGGKSAVRGVKNLVSDPIGTVEGTVSGVGKIFGRVNEGLFGSERSEYEEGRLESVIGFAETKREYAAEFGVDAYSHNAVLQDELDDIAWTGFAGELAPGAALAAVPGGAGVALSVTQNTDMLNEVFRNTSPIDLRKMNRKKLIAMGVTEDAAELFIDNAIYTPREQTLLVAALDEIKGVKGREAFVKTAILADNADLTYFRQRQAQMYAAYHQKMAPIGAFVPIGQLAAAQLADGTLVFVVPLDLLAWTGQMGNFITDADAWIDQALKPKGVHVVLAGTATDLAKSKMGSLGWTVIENGEARLLPKLPY